MATEIKNTACAKDCPNSCSLKVHIKDGKMIKVEGADNSFTNGFVCVKGLNFPKTVYDPHRILQPLKRTGKRGSNQFESISWDSAFQILFDQLSFLKEKYGPESVVYMPGSGNFGVKNEYPYGFWYQYGGYTALYGNLCDKAANAAIGHTYGSVKHNKLSDLQNAKLIILWGGNPARTNIKSMHHINKAIDKGAKLVVIDPRRNESSKRCMMHIAPRCGTDGLLALGIAKLLIENKSINRDFLDQYAHGFDGYEKWVCQYSIQDISKITDVKEEEMQSLVRLIQSFPLYALVLGTGLQRYVNGGQTIRAIGLLPPLTGSIGKSGCGLYSNNKQAPSLKWPYYPHKPNRIRESIHIGRIASQISTQKNPKIQGIWIEKANPMVSNPNANKLKEALNALDFIVVLDHFMTETAKYCDLFLPTTTFFEQNDLLKAYGHPYIQMKQKVIEPMGEVKEEKEIYRILAQKFGFDMSYLPEDDEKMIKKIIEMNELNTSFDELKNVPYYHKGIQEIAFNDYQFDTPSGKIEFYCEQIQKQWDKDPFPVYSESKESQLSEQSKKYPLNLLSVHSRNRINSQQLYGCDAQPALYIHEKDASKREISDGNIIRVFNDRGEIKVTAKITSQVKQGLVSMEFGSAKAVVNCLTDDLSSDFGNGTAYHNCLVDIQKV